jgi:uncharacterized caspase-like protein
LDRDTLQHTARAEEDYCVGDGDERGEETGGEYDREHPRTDQHRVEERRVKRDTQMRYIGKTE